MHRYRDALIHLEKADDGVTEKSRPVVGAFVLYPGFFDSEDGLNPYQDAIESVGIGGFPLLPGQTNRWLKGFLADKFGDLSASKLLPAALSAGGIRKFRFRLTGASDLQNAQNWSDLSERYASFVEKSVAAI